MNLLCINTRVWWTGRDKIDRRFYRGLYSRRPTRDDLCVNAKTVISIISFVKKNSLDTRYSQNWNASSV